MLASAIKCDVSLLVSCGDSGPGWGKWKESDKLDSSKSFYQLHGLQPGTQYGLEMVYNNTRFWDMDIQTDGAGKLSHRSESMDPALGALLEMERILYDISVLF